MPAFEVAILAACAASLLLGLVAFVVSRVGRHGLALALSRASCVAVTCATGLGGVYLLT